MGYIYIYIYICVCVCAQFVNYGWWLWLPSILRSIIINELGMRIWQTIMEWQRVLNTGHWNFLRGTPNRLWKKILRYRSFAPLDFCTYCVELLICYIVSSNIFTSHGQKWPNKKMVSAWKLRPLQPVRWMDQHPNSIPPCHEFSTRFCQSASAGLQFYARAARCHGTLLRKGRRSLGDGGGVGLNLAMGSINLRDWRTAMSMV